MLVKRSQSCLIAALIALLCDAISAFSTTRKLSVFQNNAAIPRIQSTTADLGPDISTPSVTARGKKLNPLDLSNAAKKEHTHVLILPGFAMQTTDYTKEGSLKPNLVKRGGFNESNVHVLPCKVHDWAKIPFFGMMNSDFVSAMYGDGEGLTPDEKPYRWFLKKVASEVKRIDKVVKKEHGDNAKAKIIIIGHSAGGWLARAALGFGTEHRQNQTKLDDELGIDIDNILAVVTLGTPNLPPPKGVADMTGGAQRITNERFPGAYFEDKLFYVSIAGDGIQGAKQGSGEKLDKFAYDAYKSVGGHGSVAGDGIVPMDQAHLTGADQVTLGDVSHAPHLTEKWYGSGELVDAWFEVVLKNLNRIQNAGSLQDFNAVTDVDGGVTQEEEAVSNVAASAVEGENSIEAYFRRRNALKYTGIWEKIKDKECLETLVFKMEELLIPDQNKVVTQGDDSDAMYFIEAGQFECFDEGTGEVKAVLGKNTVFGELGVLLGEKRALSVRAASANAVVYRLSKEDVLQNIDQNENAVAAKDLKKLDKYKDHFEDQLKRDALLACPVFQKLGLDDIKRLTKSMKTREVGEGERIIEEGGEGSAMYFVADGYFQCYKEATKQILKICKRGDYFGELGILFDKPRACSVAATSPSTVWELEGDAFIESYRKATAEKFGGASWVLPIVKVLRVLMKKVERTSPDKFKRIKSRWNLLQNQVSLMKDRVYLHNVHATGDSWKGTRTHIQSALASVAVPMGFLSTSAGAATSTLSRAVLLTGFVGLVFDNFVNASGKYIGEGDRLKWLCKLRSIAHGFFIPLLFVPVIESAMTAGVFPKKFSQVAMGLVSMFAVHEAFDWMKFDTKEMRLVDSREAEKNTAHALSGTLWYSSGKVLKNVIPAAILNLSLLVLGSILKKRGDVAGYWLLISGIITFIASGIQKPAIQCYSEPAMVGLIWAAAARLPPPV